MRLTRRDTSDRALQDLVWWLPAQLPCWSRATLSRGSCQIWILENSPSYWVLWDMWVIKGGSVDSGSEAEAGTEGGFPDSWEIAWITGLWDGRHDTVAVSQMCFPSPQKEGWGCAGWGGLVGSAEELASGLKLRLLDHFKFWPLK